MKLKESGRNMYKYYNANPRGLSTDDCVKRAISVATGMEYKNVQLELNRYKRVTGAESFNSDYNPHRYVEDVLNAKKITVKKMTAGEFCRKYPKGRYILDMESHWSACVDGIIYDTWDCSKKTVNFAYEVTIKPYTPPNLKKQVFKYCCTSERISNAETIIRIYDGNGAFVERKIPTELTQGYILCLQHSNYQYIDLDGGKTNEG